MPVASGDPTDRRDFQGGSKRHALSQEVGRFAAHAAIPATAKAGPAAHQLRSATVRTFHTHLLTTVG